MATKKVVTFHPLDNDELMAAAGRMLIRHSNLDYQGKRELSLLRRGRSMKSHERRETFMSESRPVQSRFAWLLVILLTLPMSWSTCWAQTGATISRPDKVVHYGMSGIVQGQTARLYVVNSAMGSGQYPPGPCRVELMFHDSQGNIVTPRDSGPLDVTTTLAPGQSTFLDLNGNSVSTGDRVGFIPCVKILCASNNPSAVGNVKASVEVFDNSTGRTSYVLVAPPDPE